MSIKTLRKRIALVAVSALGVGLLSVAPASATGIMVIEGNGLALFTRTSATCAATTNDNTSKGLVVQAGTGTGITAVMLPTGSLSVFVPATASATNELVVSGGIISAVTGDTTDPTLNANFTKATAASGKNICALVIPNGVGTMTLYSYSGTATASAPVGVAVVTVAAAGVSGTPSVSDSTVALNDANSTNVSHPTNGTDSLTGGTVAFGSKGSIYVRARDAYTVGINSSAAIATATNGALVKWDSLFPTTSSDVASVDWTSANHYVGVIANGAAETTVTITVSGVVLGSKTITFLGDIATLEASAAGVQSTATGGTTLAASATVGRLLSFKVKDSKGRLVPEGSVAVAYYDGANAIVSTATVQTAQSGARVASGLGGNGYWVCRGPEGSASIRLSTKDSTGKTIISNPVTVKCADDHATYAISTDKATYNPGDVATVTVTFKTYKGTVPNDQQNMAQGYSATSDTACTASSANTPTLTSAAFKSLVTTPACGDLSSDGVIKYRAVIDQTPGTYQVAFAAPAIDALALGGAPQTASIKVVSATTTVTNAEVLAAIVKLIASINKQIKALQKSLRR